MRNTARGTRHGVVASLMIGSVLLGGGMFLAGCSASSNSAASSSEAAGHAGGQAAGRQAGPAAAATAPGKAAAPGSAFGNTGGQGGTGTTARLAPASSIIYTAQLTVRAGDVSSAVAQAARIADGVGGDVSCYTAMV